MRRMKDGSPKSKKKLPLGISGRLGFTLSVMCILVIGCLAINSALVEDEIMSTAGNDSTQQIEQNDNNAGESANTEANQDNQDNQSDPDQQTFNFGQDAESDTTDDSEYFVNYRLEREKVRSQQLELLNELAAADDTTAEAKAEAEQKVVQITENMEIELVLEGVLAGKYGGEAAVFVQEDKVNVILAPTLKEIDDIEAEKIAELANNYTGVGFENAVIIVR